MEGHESVSVIHDASSCQPFETLADVNDDEGGTSRPHQTRRALVIHQWEPWASKSAQQDAACTARIDNKAGDATGAEMWFLRLVGTGEDSQTAL